MLDCENRKDLDDDEKEVFVQKRAIQKALMLINFILVIQESLSGDDHDIQKAKDNLEELLKQQFTFLSLMYAPFVVKTVYQCRKYKGSEDVRITARKCYRKFKMLFGIPHGENFENVFQTSVRDFWKNQKFVCDWEHIYINGINGKIKYQEELMEKEIWQKNNNKNEKEQIKNDDLDKSYPVIERGSTEVNGII